MISTRSWPGMHSLLAAMLCCAISPSSTTAFLADSLCSRRNGVCSNIGKSYVSSELAAGGGFGKASAGTSSSSKKQKKKKNSKKPKTTKTIAAVPPYIPFDSFPDGSNDDSGSPSPSPSPREQTKALLDWLEEEEVEGLDGVEIGFSRVGGGAQNDSSDGFLRGVFARRDFGVGEYILAVPFVTTILVDEKFDVTAKPGDKNLRANEPEVGFALWEKFVSSSSKNKNNNYNNNDDDDDDQGNYKAFLDCIPLSPDDPNFDGTPDFWSEDEIRQLEIPKVIDNMLSRKEAIANLSRNAAATAHDNDSDNDSDSDIESGVLSAIQQCCHVVQSRAFTTWKKAIDLLGNEGLLSRVVLVPFIDMINHDSESFANVAMNAVETKEYDESFYALVATRPIRRGQELRLCYGTGTETALELFCKYGFLPAVAESDRAREAGALERLVEGAEWSTTLEEDRALLLATPATREREPMRTILSVRIYAKSLLAHE